MKSHQPSSPEMLLRSDADHAGVPPFRELVAVEPYGAERFRGVSPLHWPGHRVFGGIVAGQALNAAGQTVADLRPHSMHAYFLKMGRPEIPLDYAVTRVRDGRSFATRSVEVTQAGSVIFTMLASFHRSEPGEDYQLGRSRDVAVPADDSVSPEEVLPHLEVLDDLDVLDVGPTEPRADGTLASTRRMWLRVREELPDDPLLHASILTLMSDMGMVTATRPPAMWETSRPKMAASLDHAVWFHRDLRVDNWLLYDLHSVSVAGSRALARGVMHAADGTLIASVNQEALIRTGDPRENGAAQEE